MLTLVNIKKFVFSNLKKDILISKNQNLNEGVTIITKPSSIVTTNNHQQKLNNSNATLDQLLKSLDDINSYLEKKFPQNKFEEKNSNKDSSVSTLILNTDGTRLINKTKNFSKKNSEPELKDLHKVSTKYNEQSSTLFLLDNNKYSYLNLNKNNNKIYQMSVDM